MTNDEYNELKIGDKLKLLANIDLDVSIYDIKEQNGEKIIQYLWVDINLNIQTGQIYKHEQAVLYYKVK